MHKYFFAATALLVAGPAWSQAAPVAGGARVQTRADVVARTQRAFAMLDANHDNVLDATELAAAGKAWDGPPGTAAASPRTPMDRNAMFDMIDTNHDGSISRDEFARAPMNHGAGGMTGEAHGQGQGRGGMGGGMSRMWAMADMNHDGRVTLQEATAFATQRFDRLDLNHDGQLTPDERTAAREQMHGQ